MKVTIYTVSDCQFSKTEKEYLTSKNIPFEEKNLETNKEFLTEMLTISNNFAGTPVTVVEKDNAEKVVLKGYTQSELDEALGLSKPAGTEPAKEAAPAPAPHAAVPTPVAPEIKAPSFPSAPATPPVPSVAPQTAEPAIPPTSVTIQAPAPVSAMPPAPPQAPAAPAVTAANDPSLDALLSDLQAKAAATKADVVASATANQPPPPPAAEAGNPTMPAIPDFGDPK